MSGDLLRVLLLALQLGFVAVLYLILFGFARSPVCFRFAGSCCCTDRAGAAPAASDRATSAPMTRQCPARQRRIGPPGPSSTGSRFDFLAGMPVAPFMIPASA